MTDAPALAAGWGFPGAALKAHYFAEEDSVSVCGRWMYTGPREPETGERSKDDCVMCVRRMPTTPPPA